MFGISLRYLQSRLYFYSSTIRKMSNLLQVKVEQGVLQGTLVDYPLGLPYKSFLGIPYAKPPVGDLRFKEPISTDHWDGVYDATKAAKISAQFDSYILKKYIGEEDCLYLNIHVPEKAKKGDNLPVMFWTHGGAYCCGYSNPDLYGGGHLVQNDVIMVAVHYRLGPLGFLYLDIEEAAGNMGLKDIALALRWVNKNISAFGGDPNNVTVFGESAGAAATHHIVMSPVTQGHFKRAILKSSVGFSEWCLSKSVDNASFKLGEELGLKTTNKKELIDFLKKVPIEELIMASSKSLSWPVAFGPVIEKNIPNVTPFCSTDLRKRIDQGDFPKIPMMLGCTSNEGFLFVALMTEQIVQNGKIDLASAIPDLMDMLPRHLKDKFDEKTIEKAITKIKEFYFPKEDDVLDGFQDFCGDHKFIKDMDYTIKKCSEHIPIYFYNFSYKGSLNLMSFLLPEGFEYKGACHMDELGYLLSEDYTTLFGRKTEPTEKDIMTIRRMTEMWTNFAKYGNPTPKITKDVPIKWDPVDVKKINCMDIGDNLTIIEDPYKHRMKLWESLENL